MLEKLTVVILLDLVPTWDALILVSTLKSYTANLVKILRIVTSVKIICMLMLVSKSNKDFFLLQLIRFIRSELVPRNISKLVHILNLLPNSKLAPTSMLSSTSKC